MTSVRHRVQLFALLALTVAAVVHHAALWFWFIEDAAISFAYAKHVADFEGLVPWVGGERVEGFSNPSWVAVLALAELVGWPAESAARWIQAALVVFTVPLTWFIAREATPDRDGPVPLLAAAFLAGSAQYAIWTASGLENALFCFLLAAAMARTLVEAREGGWPWSAALFFALAITRPEAILYAAMGGFCAMVFTLSAGRGVRPTLAWLATFWVPFTAYHAARFTYFAWPWPQTWYAKMGTHREPRPFEWNRAGWLYLRNWLDTLHIGPYLAVVFLGVTGGRGPRAMIGLGAVAIVGGGALLLTDQTWIPPMGLALALAAFSEAMTRALPPGARRGPQVAGVLLTLGFLAGWAVLHARGHGFAMAPSGLPKIFPWVVAGASVSLPLVAVGSQGWQARAMCWGMACISVFFATYSLGDWMKGFRWFSLMAVPLSVLLGCGAGALGDLAQQLLGARPTPRWSAPGYTVAVLLVAAWGTLNVEHTKWFENHRETSPYHVRKRVEYTDAVADRILLERPFDNLDIDQGAHLYWSDHRMLDVAGLVDVAFAQNRYDPTFLREYVYEQRFPAFAHMHDYWANTSTIPSQPWFPPNYIELPGYVSGSHTHIGNHIRRDLLFAPEPPAWAELEPVTFGDSATLLGVRVPSPEVTGNGEFLVEVAVRRGRGLRNFRLHLLVVHDDELHVHELPMGYDWFEPRTWRADDVFLGRYVVPAPRTFARWDLGFVVVDDRGVIAASTPAEHPVMAAGEVRFAEVGPVTMADGDARAAQREDLEAALALAADDCAGAESRWWLARMHQPRSPHAPWRRRADEVRAALARCWAEASQRDPDHALEHLIRAQRLDHWEPTYRALAGELAEARHAEGLAARDEGRWDEAFQAFDAAARLVPTRAWSRRYAEEARAHRLGTAATAATATAPEDP